MIFELDLQVLRHSDEAVQGARAEEEDGMAANWEGTKMDELLEAFKFRIKSLVPAQRKGYFLQNLTFYSR